LGEAATVCNQGKWAKTMRTWVTSLALGALLLAASVDAQQPGNIPRVGYVSGAGDPSNSWAWSRGVPQPQALIVRYWSGRAEGQIKIPLDKTSTPEKRGSN
jgi:hypothetical protein